MWQSIETAPSHKDILLYRKDAGVFMGRRSYMADWLVDENAPNINELTDDELWNVDWWSYERDGVMRLDADLAPTHWMPLPPEPAN